VSERKEQKDTGLGEETKVERIFNRYVGDAIHIFLSILAVLILAAAAIAAFEMLRTDVPKLWQQSGGYKELQQIISSVLLVAIAAELGLLLLFHRTSAAIEVIIFVIARKIVTPDVSAMELLLSVAALAGLLIVRFYYLPGKPK
jgi:hypothetical protein